MGTELDRRCEGAELLRTALYKSNINLSDANIELLACHLDLVIDKNRTMNLTRIDSFEDGAYLHVADSLLLLSAFDKAPKGAFVDVGTGAGFPGIPLAVATGRKALLVDSVGKKAAAVREFVCELGIDKRVEVSNERIEVLGKTRRGRYAVVTARAVAQTNVLIEYAAPLLKSGGHLVVAKARISDEELDAANRAARVCGLKNVSRETFELPDNRGHREVLSYERVGNPSIKLPRAIGMAQHHPLGL
jgi:16S rRNA (guanine527-N7)-methyltransferase